MVSPVVAKELVHGWQFRETDADHTPWLSVGAVPTCVHLDLMAHGRIPDPFLGFNELEVQWVGERTWTYRVDLPVLLPSEIRKAIVMVFDGLDTFANVKLNGKVVLRASNMFLEHRVDVTDFIKLGYRTTLSIDFEPAFVKAHEIREQHPEHKWICWNGDSARLGVRKAQCHWGWDWGPCLMTAGPWKPVRIESYDVRIEDLWTDYVVNAEAKLVQGSFSAALEGTSKVTAVFRISVAGQIIAHQKVESSCGKLSTIKYTIPDAQLWYPHGYGSQPKYDFSVELVSDGVVLDRRCKSIGLRQVELVQRPDSTGKSFYFRINGIEIFCGGSNWIPADTFLTRVTREKYLEWMKLMVDGNQVMIRVWGGGIWESDDFYNACDELGIMVWQDFPFACGNYPIWDAMLASIRDEAKSNIRRIRHHCSIVLYAGNNEDYQVQESNGLTYNYEDKDSQSWLTTDFPARFIYEKLFPEVIKTECSNIPYHPGSPWGDGRPTSDPSVGDMHQWNVWHGTQEKYQMYDQMSGRFNSEFGMEAFPHYDTVKYYCGDESLLYPQSKVLDFHNKAAGHERRIATYVFENFRLRADLKGFIHLTQIAQSEALSFAYRAWRKNWGLGRLCGGALVWQLNDCWPVTSWSTVDYFLRKKPGYYVMARTLAPIAVGIQRAYCDWSASDAQFSETSDYELWVASSHLDEKLVTVELRFVSTNTGKDVRTKIVRDDVRIAPNGTTSILKGTIDNTAEELLVLAARIFVNGVVIARDTDWPQPLKWLSFKDRELKVNRSGVEITVTAAKPTKGVVFEERDGIKLSDSAIDVVPGDEQTIKVQGLPLDAKPLSWTYLGNNE